jgi:hypothetical protein
VGSDRQVVWAFIVGAVVRRIFRHGAVEPALKFPTQIWIGIPVQRQRSRGTLQQYM